MDRKALLPVTVLVEGGLFLFGILLMGGPHAVLAQFNLSWSATVFALLLCLPMVAALYLAMRSEWEALSRLRNELDEKILPIFANCKIIDLAMIAFLAGIGEELFFRGWLQGVLTNKFGMLLGILTASGIFGFAHYLSPTYALYAGLTGVYLGAIYQISGNLYIVMAIHALYDFIALVYLVQKGKGNGKGFEQLKNETV